MKRHDHRPEKANPQLCRRCGLRIVTAPFGGRCPPGYWLTKPERAEWDRLTAAGETARRDAWVRELGARPARRTG